MEKALNIFFDQQKEFIKSIQQIKVEIFQKYPIQTKPYN